MKNYNYITEEQILKIYSLQKLNDYLEKIEKDLLQTENKEIIIKKIYKRINQIKEYNKEKRDKYESNYKKYSIRFTKEENQKILNIIQEKEQNNLKNCQNEKQKQVYINKLLPKIIKYLTIKNIEVYSQTIKQIEEQEKISQKLELLKQENIQKNIENFSKIGSNINQLLKHINIKNTLNQEAPLTQEDCHKILSQIALLEQEVKNFIE